MNIRLLFILLIIFISTGCTCQPVYFDETKAFDMLKDQAKMTERFSGGSDMEKCRAYLKEKLEPNCDIYLEQNWTENLKNRNCDFRNIIGIINPKAEKYIILGSHYDNRPISDEEWTRSLQKQPCPGANDGASSTALLLEAAKVLHSKKPKVGVVIVLFDGEDFGQKEDEMYVGSRYFARHINDIFERRKADYGIVLDMVGDKDLNIYIEKTSNAAAPDLVAAVWKQAEILGHKQYFIPKAKYGIADDHDPLIEKGIKCIDIIDFDYKYWHTTKDTADKCSPKSLGIVAEVVLNFIYSDFKF